MGISLILNLNQNIIINSFIMLLIDIAVNNYIVFKMILYLT